MTTASTTSLKLDAEMKERVQKVATTQRRTAHWVMREAIEQYVEREEKRERYLRDGMAAWEDYQTTGLHLTEEEVDAWLGKLATGEDAELPECHV